MNDYVNKNCPICGGNTFENDLGDVQCESCRAVLPFTNNTKENVGGLYGWICPKCGATISPYTSFCPHCTKINWEVTYTAGGGNL